MPVKKRRDVEAGLLRKGFQRDEGDHHYFTYQRLSDGKYTGIFTKTSHSGDDLDDFLLGRMARQCRVNKKQFIDLVDCPLSRQDYEGIAAPKDDG
jgi:hypothetical protein